MTLFGLLTYASIQMNSMRFGADLRKQHQQHYFNRYFWWGSVRLDSDPLGKRPMLRPCVEESDANCDWNPLYIWVDPGLLEKTLVLSALPAFLLAITIVRGLAHLGINELLSFMVAMPPFTIAWFYGVGWLLDRWRYKRSLHRAVSSQQLS